MHFDHIPGISDCVKAHWLMRFWIEFFQNRRQSRSMEVDPWETAKKDASHLRIGNFSDGTNLAKYCFTERIIKKIFDGIFSPEQWYTRGKPMAYFCAKNK